MSEDEKIKISWTDLDAAPDAPASGAAGSGLGPLAGQSPGGGESWGRVAPIGGMEGAQNVALPWWLRLVYKPWFYLTLAGCVAAFLAWGICEPFIVETEYGFSKSGVTPFFVLVLFPLMVIFMCTAFSTIESAVERSWAKAVIRGAASFMLGLVLASIFYFCANVVMLLLVKLLASGMNAHELNNAKGNPIFWVVRAIAWSLFGVCGGLVYGTVSLSWKKVLYGVLGGVVGGAIGGFLFDPIGLLTEGMTAGAWLSRGVGMTIIGAVTGLAIGIVEDVAKSAWVQIQAGRLVGKQFILYRNPTRIGSLPANEIYLFKDRTIAGEHAQIQKRGNRFFLVDMGSVAGTHLNGRPVRDHQLKDGDLIQIGETVMRYGERSSG
jgi:hypothetical protein